MPLDMKYLEFCQDGSPFYVPSKSATVNPYKVDIPKEWSKHIHGPWTSLTSPNTELPIQGWKIHVTATLDNAQSILDAVCSYCFEHGPSRGWEKRPGMVGHWARHRSATSTCVQGTRTAERSAPSPSMRSVHRSSG